MTGLFEPIHDELHVVDLPYGEIPHREARDGTYPGDCDPDGDPLPLIIDTPDDARAVVVVAGHVRWWATCQAIRNANNVGVWSAPAGVVIAATTGDGEHLITGPGGSMIVRRTVPVAPIEARQKGRSRS